MVDVPAEPERAGGDPVGAVGPDDSFGPDGGAVQPHVTPSPSASTAVTFAPSRKSAPAAAAAFASWWSSRRRCVISTSGPSPAALDPAPVAEPELERVDDVLDDRRRVDRQLVARPQRDPAAAGLVAREARPVEQEHPHARAREAVGRDRAARPGADDDRVEALHG